MTEIYSLFMLYIGYLDEFGHDGPYLSRNHPNHKTHPVFGLGGFVLPATTVRDFAHFFFNQKNLLLSYEIEKSGEHRARWEKKGSALYTVKNITKYRQLRVTTNRLLNKINTLGGWCFFYGQEKYRSLDTHDSKKLHFLSLRAAIQRIDRECEKNGHQFLLIVDQKGDDKFRKETAIQSATTMFGGNNPSFSMIEPPIQAESHLYQTLQMADWLCGIYGRLSALKAEPDIWPEFEVFDKYFSERLESLARNSKINMLPKHTPPSEQMLLKLQQKFNP